MNQPTAASPVQLDPEQLVTIAVLVANLVASKLSSEGVATRPQAELISAKELAARIGRTREFVYTHKAQLGAVYIGDGPQPRLAFRWPQVLDQLNGTPLSQVATPPPAATRRRRKPTEPDLLPIGRSRVLHAAGGS